MCDVAHREGFGVCLVALSRKGVVESHQHCYQWHQGAFATLMCKSHQFVSFNGRYLLPPESQQRFDFDTAKVPFNGGF